MLVNFMNKNSGLPLSISPFNESVVQMRFLNYYYQRFIIDSDDNGFVTLRCDLDDTIHTTSSTTCSIAYALELTSTRSGDHFQHMVNRSVYSGADNQKWWLQPHNNGYFSIHSKLYPDFVFDVSNSSMNKNSAVIAYAYHGGDNQQWRLTPTSRVLFPPLTETEVAKYSLDYKDISSKLHHIMDEHGFCVINGVLSHAEVKEALHLWGEDLMGTFKRSTVEGYLDNHASEMKEDSPAAKLSALVSSLETAPLDRVPDLWPGEDANHKEYSCHGLAQAKFAWRMRENAHVKQVYATMYNTSDLVVGMDCVFFSGRRAPPDRSDSVWGHADQNIHEEQVAHWDVYQSVVPVWDLIGDAVSTTVVWPGSHKHVFDKLMREDNLTSFGQFAELVAMRDDPDTAAIQEQYMRQARRIPIKAGSLIIWNSKTIHQGWNKGPRLAMPICWEPRDRREEEAFNRKLRLAASGIPSTHWASLGRQHNIPLEKNRLDRQLDFGKNGDDIYLPMRELLPFPVKNGLDWEKEVLPLCLILEQTHDSDKESAKKLAACLKENILSML